MDDDLNYARSLLFKLNTLRKDSVLCDVKIKICDVVFNAHRVLLCAASPYFQVMFCGGMVETSQPAVKLHGVSSEMFAILLDYIYSGTISINSCIVQELLAAAQMLQLDDVVEYCCAFLSKELTPSNCLGILLFSDLYSRERLYKTALNFIQRNFKEVTQNDEFLQLDLQTLLIFIKSDEIKINKEEDVFVAVLRWMLHDVPNRCPPDVIREVLKHVRLPLLTPECVESHLKKCSNAGVVKIMYTLYDDSLRNQQLPQNTIYRCPRTYAQKYFYIIGGFTRKPEARWSETVSLSDIERCNLTSANSQISGVSPTRLCPMNHARNGLGVAAVNGLIYAIGGEKDSLIYDSVECYNPVLNEWSLIASMVAPRVGLGACVVDNEIYVIGGWVGSEIAKTMEKYNPDDDCWMVVGDVATPRHNAGVCEMDGLIYIVGGMDDHGEELQTGECYDPIREKWISIAPMLHKRSCVSMVSMDGLIYAIGGCTGSDGGLDSVEKYNVQTNMWEEVEPLPSARISASAIQSGSFIFVFGGRTLDYPPKILDCIDCYDTRKNKWFSIGKLLTGRSEAGVAII